ncbi:hypothetical protein C2G38_2108497 [Gigaspora rosea]|uniref:Uncharacterized protein n=1 Tax=Gigaspora rosea TaxID=44941 RepID=A0A397UGS5_9GLOM|nr:hypothetical protein C2G38_2108497 [Gigaspora rosea]
MRAICSYSIIIILHNNFYVLNYYQKLICNQNLVFICNKLYFLFTVGLICTNFI